MLLYIYIFMFLNFEDRIASNCGIAKHIEERNTFLWAFSVSMVNLIFRQDLAISCYIFHHLPSAAFLGPRYLRLKPRTSIRKAPRSWNKREQSLGVRLAPGPYSGGIL